jgi:D-alanyl-D-alanine carboxypeptidase
MADVEHHVHLKPEMRFRLASITKQFTAAAIMLLADEGKLSVTDDIAKFLPDYPTHGMKITIENLLTHTSGIKNDTDIHGFAENMSADMSVQQVIDFFKNEPLDFDPGTRFSYSNSGYILLGAIIEQISGQSYASFMAQRIFEPLGMTQTAYEGYERGGITRVQGYSGNRKAPLISMTQPYAAGGLVSTVDDLARWDAAISSGQLLKAETWRKVFTPYALTSGKATHYAYGWMIGDFKGHQTAAHGGAIAGFSSCAIRLPKEKIFVAVLTNNDRSDFLSRLAAKFTGNEPCALAAKLAAVVLDG